MKNYFNVYSTKIGLKFDTCQNFRDFCDYFLKIRKSTIQQNPESVRKYPNSSTYMILSSNEKNFEIDLLRHQINVYLSKKNDRTATNIKKVNRYD